MGRLIDAEKFLSDNSIYADCEFDHPKYQETLREIVNIAPTVDAVPVEHGHWIIKRSPSGAKYSVCSECETYVTYSDDKNSLRKLNFDGAKYCPNCGARMIESDNGAVENERV